MKFVIESDGQFFTGTKKGEQPGAFLDEYGEPRDRGITKVLRSAVIGGIANSQLTIQEGFAVETAIEATPTKRLVEVPGSITPVVRFALGEGLEEMLAARTRAIEDRAGSVHVRGELHDEYLWNVKYLTDPKRVAPVHVTHRGFVLDRSQESLAYNSLHTAKSPKLTHEQRQHAVAHNLLFVGQFVPMRVSDEGAPIVTGLPVPTIGTEEAGQYVPKVVLHTELPSDWQPVTW